MATVRNPLEPLSSAVKGIVTLLAALTLAGLLGLFVDGMHLHVLGIGDKSVCVADQSTTMSGGEVPPMEFRPAPGATIQLDAHPSYCTGDPTTAQSLLHTAIQVPPFVFSVGALLLVLLLIRGAEREGLYTTRTAGRLRRLGWWLSAGSVLAAIAESTTEQSLVRSLSRNTDASAVTGLLSWDMPFMAILTGLGVLSFARVMRIGIAMREDLDGTV
ncbi:DUF2975 domain-containing protein [Streptomyces sp. NBC_00638]|uniref:DUF2975 domain-containing protein n=1 Tax=Streptomyces sp. NBC_00638 TaxID=2975794 RepID=UPI00225A7A78|nr:DUF2975 domain-containing protein [Streptomyces sp. NBC_00638]MCX5008139.1 DUF2975 domain-containing protein [Streptomyces sp. NBC_00638]